MSDTNGKPVPPVSTQKLHAPTFIFSSFVLWKIQESSILYTYVSDEWNGRVSLQQQTSIPVQVIKICSMKVQHIGTRIFLHSEFFKSTTEYFVTKYDHLLLEKGSETPKYVHTAYFFAKIELRSPRFLHQIIKQQCFTFTEEDL